MPRAHGYSPETFEKNIRELYRANKRRKRKRTRSQILAIAYAEARQDAEAAGKHPRWLRRRRKTKHRRSR